MERLESPAAARAWCAAERAAGHTLGFVPTMGALHAGHLELVRRAVRENDRACVSIFVNPLQFDDPGDLARYPRDFAGDTEQLAGVGCSMAFTGTLAEFFPGELDAAGALPAARLADPGPCAAGLEGEHRPGHFAGVATIVQRLFEIVEPTRAYFGRKDFQQALVVTDLARRRGGPEIVVHPTVREPSGLALSSRNALLDAAGRAAAPRLSAALRAARAAWRAGERDPRVLERVLVDALAGRGPARIGSGGGSDEGPHRGPDPGSGLEIEYAAVRDPRAWTAGTPPAALERAVALVAARAGEVRLIDNELLSEDG